MFNLHHKADLLEIERFSCALTEANAKLAAVSRSMAMIEFSPDGTVLDANENFCKVMGYSADEVRGKAGEDDLAAIDALRGKALFALGRADEARAALGQSLTRRAGRPNGNVNGNPSNNGKAP